MKKFILLLIGIVFLTVSVNAEKVYSPSGSVTAKTYNARGYVSRIMDPFFQYIASLGMVSNVITEIIYGENPAISEETEDIWGGGGSLTYAGDASADAKSVASSSALDIYPIIIKGLDISGDAVTQTLTLTGTTRVALTTNLWRVQSIEHDSTADNAGNIIVYAESSTIPSLGDVLIRGVMLAGNNKSLMGFHTIPNDMVGVLLRAETGINQQDATTDNSIEDADSVLYTRKYGKNFVLRKRVNLVTWHSQVYQDNKIIPLLIPGLSDIKYTVTDATDDAIGAFGSFEIIIFPEDMLEDDFLSGIGQPGF